MWCEAMFITMKLPFLMPEFWDEFLVTLAESGLFVCTNQTTAVQEELSERRTGEERKTIRENRDTIRPNKVSKSWQDMTLPVGQGLKSCIHVAWVSYILHPCQAFKWQKPEKKTCILEVLEVLQRGLYQKVTTACGVISTLQITVHGY